MTDKEHVREACRGSSLANEDLLPARQTWNWYNIFAFWMSDVHSVGGYVFAGTLFSLGLSGWQVFASLIIGILIVQVLANWIGVASQRTAVPFPVMSRMTFGVLGANIPALIRGLVAVVWYGIQTYLASAALMVVVLYAEPEMKAYVTNSIWGLSTLGWICFLTMWALQTALFLCSMETIRRFIDWAGPAVYAVMVLLMIYIIAEAGWDNISFTLTDKEMTAGEVFWKIVVGVSLIVSYFSGPTLNFGDFSRYAKSVKDMRRGNFWGLPVNFVFFSTIAVVTISGTPAVFGEMLIDPIAVMSHLDSKWVALLLGFTLLTATVGVNIVANFVSASFDISNVFPKLITWRTGGLIAAVVCIVMLPWNLFRSPEVIHYTIDALAGFVGPIYGIMVTDYYLVKRCRVDVKALFSMSPEGPYWYGCGVNLRAVAAMAPAGLLSVAAILAPEEWGISNFSFFIGSVTAAVAYRVIMRGR